MDRPSNPGLPLDPLALTRVPAKIAAPVAVPAKLPPAALALLTKDETPRQFLDALLAREMFPEAIRFLAFALPVREAIWWACQCVRYAKPELPNPQELALRAATRWVVQPTEAHRREAESAADTRSAAGYAAKAVAWTGGSLLPPSLPVLKPGPGMPHDGVAAAITLAVTGVAPDKVKEARRHALVLGINVAKGKHLWAPPAANTPPAPTRPPSQHGLAPRPRTH
jgi:hypothetical protein